MIIAYHIKIILSRGFDMIFMDFDKIDKLILKLKNNHNSQPITELA
ncbi:hypothetical protein ES708_05245 [subsurface metagenome]